MLQELHEVSKQRSAKASLHLLLEWGTWLLLHLHYAQERAKTLTHSLRVFTGFHGLNASDAMFIHNTPNPCWVGSKGPLETLLKIPARSSRQNVEHLIFSEKR